MDYLAITDSCCGLVKEVCSGESIAYTVLADEYGTAPYESLTVYLIKDNGAVYRVEVEKEYDDGELTAIKVGGEVFKVAGEPGARRVVKA
jgi:hypothetical protein